MRSLYKITYFPADNKKSPSGVNSIAVTPSSCAVAEVFWRLRGR